MSRKLLISVLAVAGLQAASASWLDSVAPIITTKEKKSYVAFTPAERTRFEEGCWTDKPITAQEYFQRPEYVDANSARPRPPRGANTDHVMSENQISYGQNIRTNELMQS